MTIDELFAAMSDPLERASAFRELRDRYDKKFIARWRRKWRVSAVACEDLLQELRLRLLVHPALKEIRQPHAYLWAIHRSVYIDSVRKELPRHARCDADGREFLDLVEPRPAPAEILEWEDHLDRAQRLLQRRAPRKADAIKYLILESTRHTWSRRRTAHALGMTCDVAKSLISESRKALARILSEIGRSLAGRQPVWV